MRKGNAIYGARGSPENTGGLLQAIQSVISFLPTFYMAAYHDISPVVRTHPLTGFKTLFVNKLYGQVLTFASRRMNNHHGSQLHYADTRADGR
jgi:alpha-ketoglutarate-dependent taurine dioxygenase